jgi:acyl dehydratase
MPLNFSLAGKTYDPLEVTVDPERIEQYAAASGDDNPRYRTGPGQIAPPIFPVVYGLPLVLQVGSDPELHVENPLMIVHGEQEMVYHRPISGGETLIFTPSLESVTDKGRGAVFVVDVVATTLEGEPVVDQRASIFVRGAGSGEERPPSSSPNPPPRGEVAAVFSRHVATDMPPRYADASGDHNPIHLDESVARAVGLPGVINHGLGSLSLVAGGLVAEIAGGDPARLSWLSVRFTDMVLPGSDLATTVWESAGRTYVFETTRDDGSVVMSGTFEVRS